MLEAPFCVWVVDRGDISCGLKINGVEMAETVVCRIPIELDKPLAKQNAAEFADFEMSRLSHLSRAVIIGRNCYWILEDVLKSVSALMMTFGCQISGIISEL